MMGIIDLEKWGKLLDFGPQLLKEIGSDLAILEKCGLSDEQIVMVAKHVTRMSMVAPISISDGLRAVTSLIHSDRPEKWEFVDDIGLRG